MKEFFCWSNSLIINLKDAVCICRDAKLILLRMKIHHPSKVRERRDIIAYRNYLKSQLERSLSMGWREIKDLPDSRKMEILLDLPCMRLYSMLDREIAPFRPSPQPQLSTQAPAL